MGAAISAVLADPAASARAAELGAAWRDGAPGRAAATAIVGAARSD
ncbi:hypothetical protein [Oryzobacter telluris]